MVNLMISAVVKHLHDADGYRFGRSQSLQESLTEIEEHLKKMELPDVKSYLSVQPFTTYDVASNRHVIYGCPNIGSMVPLVEGRYFDLPGLLCQTGSRHYSGSPLEKWPMLARDDLKKDIGEYVRGTDVNLNTNHDRLIIVQPEFGIEVITFLKSLGEDIVGIGYPFGPVRMNLDEWERDFVQTWNKRQ